MDERILREDFSSMDLDEENLLIEQEKFLRSGEKPAAKVTRVKKPEISVHKEPKVEVERDVVTLADPVFFEIKERDSSEFAPQTFAPPKFKTKAFPEVLQLGQTKNSAGKSLFSTLVKKEVWLDSLKERTKEVNVQKKEEEELHKSEPRTTEREFVPKPNPSGSILDSLRFDFEGNIVTTDVPEHMGLHHHGDEPDKGGYSLPEILHLSRSTVPSQRALNLQILTAVLNKAKYGGFTYHEGVNVMEELTQLYDIPLLLRIALDDQNATVIVAALNAVHALLVFKEEDRWFYEIESHFKGVENLSLEPELEQPEDEQESDRDFIKRDLVGGLLRTNIVQRLKFLLEFFRIPSAVDPIFDVLTALCRHSAEAAKDVASPEFLEFLLDTFIDPSSNVIDSPYGKPLAKAIKLVKVICQTSRRRLSDVNDLSTLDRVRKVVMEPSKLFQNQLVLESLKLWRVSASYGLSLDKLNLYEPLLHTFLEISKSNVESVPWELVTNIVLLSEEISHTASASCWKYLGSLAEASISFLQLLVNRQRDLRSGNHITVALASIFRFLAVCLQHTAQEFPLQSLGNFLSSGHSIVQQIVQDTQRSVVLPSKPLLAGLPIYMVADEARQLRDHQNFCLSFVQLVYRANQLGIASAAVLPVLQQLFVQLSGPTRELPEVVPDINRHYLRVEVFLSYYLIKLFWSVFPSTQTQERRDVQDMAMQVVPLFLPGDQYFLNDLVSGVVFRRESATSGATDEDFKLLHTFYLRYLADPDKDDKQATQLVLGIANPHEIRSLLLPKSSVLPLPSEWLFLPINLLYQTMKKQEPAPEDLATELIHSILTIILQFEQSNSKYISGIDPGTKFYHLMQVYLVNSTSFLETRVERPIADLFEAYSAKQMEFEGLIGGHFFTFFREFIDQFASASFGNVTFGKFLHYFMRMSNDLKYRHAIWTELKEVLPLLGLVPPIGGLHGYLFPTETDDSMLFTYQRSLTEGRITPQKGEFMYWIAVHHLSMFIFGNGGSEWVKQELMKNLVTGGEKETFFHVLNYISRSPIEFPPSIVGNIFWQFPARVQFIKQLTSNYRKVGEVLASCGLSFA